jgi:hypothetical protein
VRSPDEAKRNPGTNVTLAPDFASLHPGLYGDMVVKRRDRSGHAFSLVVGIEREVLVMVLSSRWLAVAPGRSRGQGWPQATTGGGA